LVSSTVASVSLRPRTKRHRQCDPLPIGTILAGACSAKALIAHLWHRLISPLVRCAYEPSALFHRHSFIEDVPHHSGTFLKHDAPGTNDTFGLATDNDFVGLYVAADGTVLHNYKMPAADIADNMTIDVEFAIGLQVALYIES